MENLDDSLSADSPDSSQDYHPERKTSREYTSWDHVNAFQPRTVLDNDVTFPSLKINTSGSVDGKDICIIIPLPKNGPAPDYAKAYITLANGLTRSGHAVTVVYCGGMDAGPSPAMVREIENALSCDKIRLVHLPVPDVPNTRGLLGLEVTTPYAVYEWLKHRRFDLVHMPDRFGCGYYCLCAKRQGLAFQNTHFCILAAGPRFWLHLANSYPVDNPRNLVHEYIERRSVEFGDFVISPTQYMLHWMLKQGYRLDLDRCFVHPFPLCPPRDQGFSQELPLDEIVFLGSLEPRKGLPQFVDAICRLIPSRKLKPLVTFAGCEHPDFPSRKFIEQKCKDLPIKWQIRPDLAGMEGVQYVAAGRRLAVIASETDNGPLELHAALVRRLPVLTTSVPGVTELIDESDHESATVRFHPGYLAKAIDDALVSPSLPLPSHDPEIAWQSWLDWHASKWTDGTDTNTEMQAGTPPLVTVCLMHFNRPILVRQAIASVVAQTYENIEVVLVDDGSTVPEVPATLREIEAEFEPRGWRVIRQENLYLGAARNTAARHARGEYLFFLDDDNVAKPNALATSVAVAQRTGADIVTSFSDSFAGDNTPDEIPGLKPVRIVQMGDNIAFGLFRNGFGDSNALIRRDAFMALGGNTEDYGVGRDDQEFFARAILAGYRLEHVPEALYWARQAPVRLRHLHYSPNTGNFRVARAYRDALPPAMQAFLLLAQGQFLRQQAWDQLGTGVTAQQLGEKLSGAMNELRDGIVGSGHPRSRRRRLSLDRLARRMFDLQIGAFGSLIAFELRVMRVVFRTIRKLAGLQKRR